METVTWTDIIAQARKYLAHDVSEIEMNEWAANHKGETDSDQAFLDAWLRTSERWAVKETR